MENLAMTTTEYEKMKEGNLKDLHKKLREVLQDAGAIENFATQACHRSMLAESSSQSRGQGKKRRAHAVVLHFKHIQKVRYSIRSMQ
jgi:hypothetical protein